MAGLDEMLGEAQRQFTICNGCRYCEGYCAVFPAMERRSIFTGGDLAYLSNLCHDCRACYQACMYAPPHQFAIDIPTLLSEARERSYARYSRPRALAAALSRGPLSVLVLSVLGSLLYLLASWAASAGGRLLGIDPRPGSFYRLVPYELMAVPGVIVSALIATVMAIGLVLFLRESRPGPRVGPRAWGTALWEVATLRWLGGGGGDCYYPDRERPSPARRVLHQLTLYGFLAGTASTSLAAVLQDLFGQLPPFPYRHPVVVLGTAGGVGMVAGATGLLWLKVRSARLASARELTLDYAFLVALDLAAATGLALMVLRGTAAMGPLLLAHLGTLVGLYLTAPYGKFVHFGYRLAALLRSAAERSEEDQAGRAAA